MHDEQPLNELEISVIVLGFAYAAALMSLIVNAADRPFVSAPMAVRRRI